MKLTEEVRNRNAKLAEDVLRASVFRLHDFTKKSFRMRMVKAKRCPVVLLHTIPFRFG